MLFDEIVVVGGFEGAEVEFADMNRLLWVKATAFPAFQIAEKFLSHSFIPYRGSTWEGEKRKRWASDDLSSFPGQQGCAGWVWHLDAVACASAGCRGFFGPVPPPLSIRVVVKNAWSGGKSQRQIRT